MKLELQQTLETQKNRNFRKKNFFAAIFSRLWLQKRGRNAVMSDDEHGCVCAWVRASETETESQKVGERERAWESSSTLWNQEALRSSFPTEIKICSWTLEAKKNSGWCCAHRAPKGQVYVGYVGQCSGSRLHGINRCSIRNKKRLDFLVELAKSFFCIQRD